MSRQRIVVVCPGRGTYNQAEWGYLARHHARREAELAAFDDYRAGQGQTPLRALDGEIPYQLELHSRGDHASALIYACAWCDALAIDRERYEVVAVTGNSMGWYIALAVAGALPAMEALALINIMGRLMQESLIGGQLIYPWMDEHWRPQPRLRQALLEKLAAINAAGQGEVYLSIDLGGLAVIGGDAAGLEALSAALPRQDRFPMRLYNHAAFHTPLQAPVRAQARERLPATPFGPPRTPLVDGRGQVWSPYSTDPEALWDYTLGHQLVAPYDFSAALRVAVREFAPERVVVLGPGSTLTGAVAQTLIGIGWQGLKSKADFQARQAEDPPVLAMGRDAQRRLVTAA